MDHFKSIFQRKPKTKSTAQSIPTKQKPNVAARPEASPPQPRLPVQEPESQTSTRRAEDGVRQRTQPAQGILKSVPRPSTPTPPLSRSSPDLRHSLLQLQQRHHHHQRQEQDSAVEPRPSSPLIFNDLLRRDTEQDYTPNSHSSADSWQRPRLGRRKLDNGPPVEAAKGSEPSEPLDMPGSFPVSQRQSRSEPIDLKSYEELPDQERPTALFINQGPQSGNQTRSSPSKKGGQWGRDTDRQHFSKHHDKHAKDDVDLNRRDQISHPFQEKAYKDALAKIEYVKEKAPHLPNLQNVIDLCNSKNTTIERTWAPAVVRDIFTPVVHHASQHLVSRDIHEHIVRLRVLPIIDIQTLPPRHYVPGPDGHLKEVHASEVQDRLKGNNQPKNWLIAETVSKKHPDPQVSEELKQLLAEHKPLPRQISNTRHMTPEGYERQETVWMHAPILERRARPKKGDSNGKRDAERMRGTDERRSYELDAEAAVLRETLRDPAKSTQSAVQKPADHLAHVTPHHPNKGGPRPSKSVDKLGKSQTPIAKDPGHMTEPHITVNEPQSNFTRDLTAEMLRLEVANKGDQFPRDRGEDVASPGPKEYHPNQYGHTEHVKGPISSVLSPKSPTAAKPSQKVSQYVGGQNSLAQTGQVSPRRLEQRQGMDGKASYEDFDHVIQKWLDSRMMLPVSITPGLLKERAEDAEGRSDTQ